MGRPSKGIRDQQAKRLLQIVEDRDKFGMTFKAIGQFHGMDKSNVHKAYKRAKSRAALELASQTAPTDWLNSSEQGSAE